MSPYRTSELRPEKCFYLGWHCERCALPCPARDPYVIDAEIEECFKVGIASVLTNHAKNA